MIETRRQLREAIKVEQEINLGNLGTYQYFLAVLKNHPRYINCKYLKLLRITEFYYSNRKKNPLYAILYFWYCRRKNNLGRKLGIELNEKSFGVGLELFHTVGTVVNGDSRIGKNCKIHGNNCIGNDGYSEKCPRLGDNIRLGVGAKVIGDIELADNITVAAGAVVVHSFMEKGITIGGVPARKIK